MRHADLNDEELELSHRMSKLRIDFKSLSAGLDNPVDNLVGAKAQSNFKALDTVLEEARKQDLITAVCSKKDINSLMGLAQDLDIFNEESDLMDQFETPKNEMYDMAIHEDVYLNDNLGDSIHDFQDATVGLAMSAEPAQPIENSSGKTLEHPDRSE